MSVRRIVANLPGDPAVASFYRALLGLDPLMDLGFLVTLGAAQPGPVQLSIGREGGSGAALPAISIEVDDFDAVLSRAHALGAAIVYGPAAEPWGVRRFYLRDPAGTLVNIVTHTEA